MSAHTKMHHIDPIKVIIMIDDSKTVSYLNPKNIVKLEKFLEKHSEEDDEPVEWEVLAEERIKKHKRAGLVLRGMRYRESISQKELAKRSGVHQNEISKIENGKRGVGEKVAMKLAEALNFNYKLLLLDGIEDF